MKVEMEENIYQFTKGQTFETYDGLDHYFHKFCELNYQPFVIRSRSKLQIIYKCCHGIQRKSKAKGQRPNQQYFFKGCGAQINLYKSKELNKWKVTKIDLIHNHTINNEQYNLYDKMNNLQDNGFEPVIMDLVLAKDKDICTYSRDIKMENNIYQFTIGQRFETYDDLEYYFYNFCQQNYQPFVIRSRSKLQIIYKCCHGIQRKSKCKGQRPNQHYYFKGCGAQINLYKNKENKWKVTKIDLIHNHTISKEEYSFYDRMNKIQSKSLINLASANTQDATIPEIVEIKSEAQFNNDIDMQNISNNLFPLYSEENAKQLKKFLMQLEEEGGTYKITYSVQNTIRTLFLASGTMMATFIKSQAPLIQIDLSISCNTENYKLMGFCYYSSITSKSEFAALAFISEDSLLNLKQCLSEFRKMCVTIPSVFLIDKDFTEISAICDIFSSSVILLCKFHIIKYLKKVLSTAYNCHVDIQNNILQLFKKVLHSQTLEEYNERKAELLNVSVGVEVYLENAYVLFVEHFNNNWDSCKEMWVYCYHKHLPTMRDSMSNCTERSFWKLQNHIQNMFCTILSLSVSIIELIRYVTLRIKCSVSETTHKVFQIMDPNPEIKNYLNIASRKLTKTGLKLYHKSLKLFWMFKSNMAKRENEVIETFKDGTHEIYNTTSNICMCTYWKSFHVPCRHILFVRNEQKMDMFSENCFHARYINNSYVKIELMENGHSLENQIEISDDSDNDEGKLLTDREKSSMAFAAIKNITDILSYHSTPQFLNYIQELKIIENNARQGLPLLNNSTSNNEIYSVIEPSQNNQNPL